MMKFYIDLSFNLEKPVILAHHLDIEVNSNTKEAIGIGIAFVIISDSFCKFTSSVFIDLISKAPDPITGWDVDLKFEKAMVDGFLKPKEEIDS